MVKILATTEQIQKMLSVNETVEFVDASGNRLDMLELSHDLENSWIARENLASDEPRLTTVEFFANLRWLRNQ